MPSLLLTLCLACCLLLSASPTLAIALDTDIVQTLSSRQMVRLLAEEGFAGASIDRDDDIIVKMHGYKVLVMVRGNDYRKVTYRFAVSGTSANLKTVNEWNKKMAFTKAYLDNEGDPVLEMDVDLDGGVTVSRIRDSIKTFAQSLSVFLQQLQEK
ncbi:MAG: YbjN domain-containing protein [Planctomycetota bacterium]|nr:YbjN domain-containing protein [Planctomycetota bacterium]